MTTEEKEIGDEYLDPGKNPMIKFDVPDEGEIGTLDTAAATSLATQLLGRADGLIDEGLRISKDQQTKVITINDRAPGEITDTDRAALLDCRDRRTKEGKIAPEPGEEYISPATNPMIKLPED